MFKSGVGLWNSPYLLLTCTAIFWAGNSIVARGARDLVPPVALSFWRWMLALLILLPVAWPHLRRDLPTLSASWPIVVALGALGIGAFNTLLYTGLQTTTAVNGLLLQSLQPGLILLLGILIFSERTRPLQAAGILLSIVGALIIVSKGDAASLLALKLNTGDLVISGAVVVWSLYSVLLRKRPRVHPLSFLATTLAVGVIVVLPFYIAEIASGRLIEDRSESWMAIAYVHVPVVDRIPMLQSRGRTPRVRGGGSLPQHHACNGCAARRPLPRRSRPPVPLRRRDAYRCRYRLRIAAQGGGRREALTSQRLGPS